MTGIIDYGAGNLHSVKNALDFLGIKNCIIKKPEELRKISRLILPGVGSFGSAVRKLKRTGLFEDICEWIRNDRPYLGICLGLQLLFEQSEEAEHVQGMGIFKGRIKKFKTQKVPQIGWNSVQIVRKTKLFPEKNKQIFFYFLHSYYAEPDSDDIITGISDYGIKYPAIINKGNIYGVQFHPEKSGDTGIELLKKWVEIC